MAMMLREELTILEPWDAGYAAGFAKAIELAAQEVMDFAEVNDPDSERLAAAIRALTPPQEGNDG